MERRLTAILAADVVGYSRLMGADEAGTLAALKSVRTDFIDGKVAEHQGRIVKLTGDGMLVEFPSVVRPIRVYNVSVENSAARATQDTSSLRDERPSIAVLAFNNMSGDAEQEYFSDGITEDITTDLSKISGLQVAARNAAFTYKGK